eukprot:Gregarina_sp_Poly_1__7774@NODE_43_length_18077_cov_117_559078_g37_i0_p3_GENE_NODE_43_length_18077_cov_117_559078_g37_i0NODE_43_length_18077_cov_117_559078_g37_i0_p3_ORF_typecomplete_len547_score70_50zfC3HC4_3/PF13920_6/4_9e08zfC3HC4_2/PF13923_6/2_7e05ProkRING_4/PF14447_6/5_7e05zfC3HC4/PF00097_25/7_9e05zfRING_2/PF13639_6/8_1e05zfRING_5/PF14634_6/0_0027zfrbx1/PF12678_7/0_0053zfTRAF/PF02176_18/0_0079zfANAPC11/PF12861_7/0_036Ubox/PF04564_15/0_051zfC3HC4_4/PF15227_6/0_35zfP11/PF03854_14/2_2zfRING_UBO
MKRHDSDLSTEGSKECALSPPFHAPSLKPGRDPVSLFTNRLFVKRKKNLATGPSGDEKAGAYKKRAQRNANIQNGELDANIQNGELDFPLPPPGRNRAKAPVVRSRVKPTAVRARAKPRTPPQISRGTTLEWEHEVQISIPDLLGPEQACGELSGEENREPNSPPQWGDPFATHEVFKPPQAFSVSVCEVGSLRKRSEHFLKFQEHIIGDFNRHWLCGICNSLDVNLIVANCGNSHHFCHDCLALWYEKQATCPMCLQPIDLEFCVPPNPILRNVILKSVVRCVHCPTLPEWVGHIGSIEAHWENFCQGHKSGCDFYIFGCPDEFISSLIPKHLFLRQRYHLTLMRRRLEIEEQEKERLMHQLAARSRQEESPTPASIAETISEKEEWQEASHNISVVVSKASETPLSDLPPDFLSGAIFSPVSQWLQKPGFEEIKPLSHLIFPSSAWLDLSMIHQVGPTSVAFPGKLSIWHYRDVSYILGVKLMTLTLKGNHRGNYFKSCLPSPRTSGPRVGLSMSDLLLWKLQVIIAAILFESLRFNLTPGALL